MAAGVLQAGGELTPRHAWRRHLPQPCELRQHLPASPKAQHSRAAHSQVVLCEERAQDTCIRPGSCRAHFHTLTAPVVSFIWPEAYSSASMSQANLSKIGVHNKPANSSVPPSCPHAAGPLASMFLCK